MSDNESALTDGEREVLAGVVDRLMFDPAGRDYEVECDALDDVVTTIVAARLDTGTGVRRHCSTCGTSWSPAQIETCPACSPATSWAPTSNSSPTACGEVGTRMAEAHAAARGFRAAFLGGPFSGCRTHLTRTPPALTIQGVTYERLDDPDTGEYLGGYVAARLASPA